jgi:hypothetical protein
MITSRMEREALCLWDLRMDIIELKPQQGMSLSRSKNMTFIGTNLDIILKLMR